MTFETESLWDALIPGDSILGSVSSDFLSPEQMAAFDAHRRAESLRPPIGFAPREQTAPSRQTSPLTRQVRRCLPRAKAREPIT